MKEREDREVMPGVMLSECGPNMTAAEAEARSAEGKEADDGGSDRQI